MAIHWRSMSLTAQNGIWRPVPRQCFLILRALHEADGGLRTRDELIDEMCADDPQGGPLKASELLRQQLYRLQRMLAGTGHYIDPEGHRGWRLLTQELHNRIAWEKGQCRLIN